MIERIELVPGYSICRVINGLWQLSAGHQREPIETPRVLSSLGALVESGFTTFDCADIYLGAEEVLGQLQRQLASSSQKIEVQTKYVPDRTELAGLKRDDVARSIEGSLRRLGVDRLDLVQLAWWDYDIGSYVEAAGWLADLQTEGKIHLIGTTNFDLPRLREIVEAGIPIATHQVQYSLLDRRVEAGMAEFCSSRDIPLLCYGVLAGGFLSDGWNSKSDPVPPYPNRSLTKYRLIIEEFGGWELHQELLECLADLASRYETSIANVATRWVLDRPGVGAVILGTRSDAHAAENRRLFDLELGPPDLNQLESVLSRAVGPAGEPFGLERQPEGRHAQIMWSDLNKQRGQ